MKKIFEDFCNENLLENNENFNNLLNKWFSLINELKEDEKELCSIKSIFNSKEFDILTNTNFNELYGQNNEKIRKEHIKKELKELIDKKEELKLKIDYNKRLLDLVKSMINIKINVLD